MVDWRSNGVVRPLSLDYQGEISDSEDEVVLAVGEGSPTATRISEAAARKAALSRRVRRGVLLERFANTCHHPAGTHEGGRFCDADGVPSGGASALDRIKKSGISDVGGVPIEQWLVNHGIGAEEFLSRGYHKWEQTGEDGIDPAINNAYGTSKAAMTQMRNAASQTSGVIMPRHVVPGSPEGGDFTSDSTR